MFSISQPGFKYALQIVTQGMTDRWQILKNRVNQKNKLPLNGRTWSDVKQLQYLFIALCVCTPAEETGRRFGANGLAQTMVLWPELGLTGNPLNSLSFKLKWTLLAGCRSSSSAKSICMVMMCSECFLHRHLFPWIVWCYVFIFYFITLSYSLTLFIVNATGILRDILGTKQNKKFF